MNFPTRSCLHRWHATDALICSYYLDRVLWHNDQQPDNWSTQKVKTNQNIFARKQRRKKAFVKELEEIELKLYRVVQHTLGQSAPFAQRDF